MRGQSFWEYLSQRQAEVTYNIEQHALLSLYAILLATVFGVALAIATYRWKSLGSITISTAAVGFTIPSVALFGFLFSAVGGNLLAVFPPLVLYALLPIVRNGIVGLQSVDPNVLDAARGMGVGRFRMLWQIELPIAWPASGSRPS